jgi:predicted AAA+ superfamily ATPase
MVWNRKCNILRPSIRWEIIEASSLNVNPTCSNCVNGKVSNAYLLSGELATLLTGRYIEISILPFSFAEYLEYAVNSQNHSRNGSFGNLENLTLAQLSGIKAYARSIFDDYLHEGGIPQAVAARYKEDKHPDQIIKAILETIIEKDVFTRQEIYNKSAFIWSCSAATNVSISARCETKKLISLSKTSKATFRITK